MNQLSLPRHRRNDATDAASLTEIRIVQHGSDFPHSKADEWRRISRAISGNTVLLKMHLDFVVKGEDDLSHAVGKKTFYIMCNGISENRSIQELALRGWDLRYFVKTMDFLEPFLQHNLSLRKLDLSRSLLDVQGLNSISSALVQRTEKSLEEICVGRVVDTSHNRVNSVTTFLSSLNGYTQLTRLGLQGISVRSNGCNTFANLIQTEHQFPRLRILDLAKCQIDDNGLIRLMSSVAEMSIPLEVLDLSRNPRVSVRGWRDALPPFLQSPSCVLEKLFLSENWINDESAITITTALTRYHRLKVLDLSCNTSNSTILEGYRTICTLLQNGDWRLEELHLRNNDIGDDMAARFATSLTNNHILKKLDLADNPSPFRSISDNGWGEFSRTLCNTSSIYTTFASNHTLFSLGLHDGNNPLPSKLTLYLQLNGHASQINGRQKILKHHFYGDFSMQPFADMEIGVCFMF